MASNLKLERGCALLMAAIVLLAVIAAIEISILVETETILARAGSATLSRKRRDLARNDAISGSEIIATGSSPNLECRKGSQGELARFLCALRNVSAPPNQLRAVINLEEIFLAPVLCPPADSPPLLGLLSSASAYSYRTCHDPADQAGSFYGNIKCAAALALGPSLAAGAQILAATGYILIDGTLSFEGSLFLVAGGDIRIKKVASSGTPAELYLLSATGRIQVTESAGEILFDGFAPKGMALPSATAPLSAALPEIQRFALNLIPGNSGHKN